jgi:hypothetical protein
MCPTLARQNSGELTLPIGFAHPKLGANSFEGARTRRRNSKGCGSIPSRSEKFGETRRSFLIFPCGKGTIQRRSGFPCPGAGKKTEAFSGRIECQPEGIPNRLIVSKSGRIHKAKAQRRIEFIAFLFNGLRGVCGLRAGLLAVTADSTESRRLNAGFSSGSSVIAGTRRSVR